MSDAIAAPSGGLRLENIRIAVAQRELLSLSAAIAPGEVLTVMGPSGSGKSSLLAYISGVLAPAFTATGEVVLDGRTLIGVPPEKRRIGILFQDDLLFPHLSVGGEYGIRTPGRNSAAHRPQDGSRSGPRAADLSGFADRDPATLSGGQRARVSLLRVLLSQPRALLLDEPFSKLDASLRASFRTDVFAEARHHGLPIMVTHDPADAAAARGRIIELT